MRKILFILIDMSAGGAEKVFTDLMRHTDFCDYKIDLCLVQKKGSFIGRLPEEVNVIPLYSGEDWKYKLPLGVSKFLNMDFWLRKRVRQKIRDRYDAVISFTEGIPLKIHSCLLKQSDRNISWVHTDLFRYHYTRKYFFDIRKEKKCYDRMNSIIFVSRGAEEGFGHLFGKGDDRKVVYNPVDREDIVAMAASFPVSRKRFTVCAAGRLIGAKGYDRLLRVARMLMEEGKAVDFWILGDGVLRSELEKQCHELGLDDSVHFLGFQPNPYPYISAADIFLSTSEIEGYPLVICEALCLGKAVVTTNVAGSVEVLGGAGCGVITDHDDHAVFAGLKKLMDHPEFLKDQEQKARKRALFFDVKQKVSEVYGLIG